MINILFIRSLSKWVKSLFLFLLLVFRLPQKDVLMVWRRTRTCGLRIIKWALNLSGWNKELNRKSQHVGHALWFRLKQKNKTENNTKCCFYFRLSGNDQEKNKQAGDVFVFFCCSFWVKQTRSCDCEGTQWDRFPHAGWHSADFTGNNGGNQTPPPRPPTPPAALSARLWQTSTSPFDFLSFLLK